MPNLKPNPNPLGMPEGDLGELAAYVAVVVGASVVVAVAITSVAPCVSGLGVSALITEFLKAAEQASQAIPAPAYNV